MENLTKEQVINCCSNANLAEALGLEYVETTIERNGYPNNLKFAMISESIDELNETADYLEKLGFEVDKYILHKKDGWHLWSRANENFFEKGQFMQVEDSDYCFDFVYEDKPKLTKKELFSFFYGDRNEFDDELLETLDHKIDELFNEMAFHKKDTRFFVDMDEKAIEYSVSEDDAYYSYDTNHYQLAIMVEDFNIED